MKLKDKDVLQLSMDSAEFDKMMRGALQAPPPKPKRKQRIRRAKGKQAKQ